MDQRLLEIYKSIKEINNDLIKKTTETTVFTCFMINEDYSIIPVVLTFGDTEQKRASKNLLKRILLNRRIKGYVIISEVKMTMINKTDNNKNVVKDAVMRNLYTAKEKRVELIDRKTLKILLKIPLSKMKDFKDDWDLWGQSPEFDSEENERYQKFKEENKDLYRDVDDKEELK